MSPKTVKIATVVLAAGRSRRMGRAKAWLPYQGDTFLQHIIDTAFAADATPVIVVAGCTHDAPPLVSHAEIKRRIVPPHAAAASQLVLTVGKPDAHPIDSLRAGLAHLPKGHAFFLWPVDYPFASRALLEEMRKALADRTDGVVIPIAAPPPQSWGHPVLLGPTVATELEGPAADQGAHLVVRRDRNRISFVGADDPRICADLNTPAAAAAAGINV